MELQRRDGDEKLSLRYRRSARRRRQRGQLIEGVSWSLSSRTDLHRLATKNLGSSQIRSNLYQAPFRVTVMWDKAMSASSTSHLDGKCSPSSRGLTRRPGYRGSHQRGRRRFPVGAGDPDIGQTRSPGLSTSTTRAGPRVGKPASGQTVGDPEPTPDRPT